MESSRLDLRINAWYAAPAFWVGLLAAAVPACLMWGFTVDDALISIRYAHNLVTGGGWAFTAHATSTDGVTPLPWPIVLAPLAHSNDLVAVLVRAKVLGILAWCGAGAYLGHRLRDVKPLLVLALVFPIGAWAASGMETGIAIALCTLAACEFERPVRAGVLAGLAAAFRPELLPWTLVIATGATLASAPAGKRPRRPVLLAIVPFALCTLLRLEIWGQPVPLAVAAKPGDAAQGLFYAVATMLVGVMPILACAPFALRGASVRAKTIVLATAVHFLVIVAVGGDWMPYARLLVPILPALAFVVKDVSTNRTATIARYLLAVTMGIYTCVGAAPAGRHVQRDRDDLVSRARPVLADAKVIAALDIGWVGAANPDATIMDLAGLTDPSIASLAGGHTSKNVDLGMLLDRKVDTLVILSPSRVVEQRLFASPLFDERFEERARLPLTNGAESGSETTYLVFRRIPNASPK